MDVITAFDLIKLYGAAPALRGVNLKVPEGAAFACVGGAGAGKTTLVRLLAGLRRPTSGECGVLGLNPAYEAARLHGMTGVVLQSARLYSSMSLMENLRFYAGVNGVPVNDGVERISFLLHRLNIWEDRDQRPGALPTGVLFRAGLARALLHRPRVLLLDEEGAGMDRETAERVKGLLLYLREEEGVTLLMCTQNMNYAQGICDGFALLHQGQLLARGDFETLRVGAGVRLKAALRLAQGQAGPAGFQQEGGFWQKEIASEAEMPELISQTVAQGVGLFEAKLVRPTLEEVYRAYLEGGRRRGEAIHGNP